MTEIKETPKNFDPTRTVRFGSISLRTNGFDRSIYNRAFARENLPDATAHPPNWGAETLADLLSQLKIPQDELPRTLQNKLFASDMTRLSAAEISEIHQRLFPKQVLIDEKHAFQESRGFFNDFAAALEFYRTLKKVGLNPWSNRIHSDLFVQGEGSVTIQSPRGVNYELAPDIWVEGMKHSETFSAVLKLPGQEQEAFGKMAAFLASCSWDDDITLKPSYMLESHEMEGVLHEKRILLGHELADETAGGLAFIYAPKSAWRTIPLYGTLHGMESLSHRLISRLDDFFADAGS